MEDRLYSVLENANFDDRKDWRGCSWLPVIGEPCLLYLIFERFASDRFFESPRIRPDAIDWSLVTMPELQEEMPSFAVNAISIVRIFGSIVVLLAIPACLCRDASQNSSFEICFSIWHDWPRLAIDEAAITDIVRKDDAFDFVWIGIRLAIADSGRSNGCTVESSKD